MNENKFTVKGSEFAVFHDAENIGEIFNSIKCMDSFKEGEDFIELDGDELLMTYDMATEITMMLQTDRGRECRRFFICAEKRMSPN